MRISTNSFYDATSSRLTDLQTKMDKIAQQVSSGRRIFTPADDAVGAAQSLELQQSQAINQQYAKNRQNLQNILGIADGTLSSMNDTLQNINEQIISAGNGTYSASELAGIATALKGQRDQLFSLTNSTDGAGHYIFGGRNSQKPPLQNVSLAVFNTTVLSFGQLQSSVQVDSSRKMEMSVNSSDIFGANADFFKKLDAAITVLGDANATSSARQTALTDLGSSYSDTLQNLTNAQASVGTRLQQLDSLNNLGSTKDANYAQALSSLQDLDYNKALSDLSRQQLALQAAQKTFMQVSNLSLFNFMK